MVRSLIAKGDYSVMRRANNWEAPRWVRLYVISATRGGDGWLWYAMGLAIAVLGGKTRFEAVGAAGVSSVMSILLFLCLKRLTGRRRPCQIAMSRILLGMHFLSDVVAGALIGTGLGYLGYFAFQ
jgi:hypothetical protein